MRKKTANDNIHDEKQTVIVLVYWEDGKIVAARTQRSSRISSARAHLSSHQSRSNRPNTHGHACRAPAHVCPC
eukprot:5283847-Pleurochrysis_carterae.AAC.1